MKKINKNFKSWLFIILVILLIVLAGFYLKGITGNVALANYLDTNYSAPYNLSNTSDYLFTISDNFLVAVDDIVNLSANVSMKGGYIYQKGYVFNQRTHSWEVFNFNQTPVENSYWIKDFASQDLVINVSNNVHNSSETYIVAYACKKDSSGAWQCGCQTESETGCKRWMLHTFNITNITISPDVNCTSDANCIMTNGTCNIPTGVCVSKGMCITNCSCAENIAIGEICENGCGGSCLGTKQDGTLSYPFAIYNWTGLNNIRNNLTASYILMNNLDESSANYSDYAGSTANDGAGWEPIGSCGPAGECHSDDYSYVFQGNFNGNGKTISDLIINRGDGDFIGLWSLIAEGAKLSNLNIIDFSFIGSQSVGGLVGYSDNGAINNCSAIGNLIGESYIGGLVGYQYTGVVTNSYVTGNVTGDWNIGGLVGYQESGAISNSSSLVKVTGSTDSIGGLVGWQESGTISNSSSSGNVSGYYIAGGLVGGQYNGIISNSSSTGIVTGYDTIGGLVGYQESGVISNSSSTGIVTGSYTIGGLVGYQESGAISNSFATGTVTCSDGSAGGLVGEFAGTISNSYATGNVSSSSMYIGGLAGKGYYGKINNSYATGNVTGEYELLELGSHAGGLVGYDSYGTINNSYATGNVNATYYVGGLVGSSHGTVSNSFATGTVTCSDGSVGALVGYLNGGKIYNSYWFNRSLGLNCWTTDPTGYNTNCTAKTTESYFKNYENAPMNLTAKTGWDFTNVWSNFGNGSAYPKLK